MEELRLMVPTYNGHFFAKEVENGETPEFGAPNVAVLIREAAGVRLVLGTHDYEDYEKPDIQIERRPGGWAIFLHPLGGGDPSGYVYFLDDGRSFLVPEKGLGSTEVIEVLEPHQDVPELDWPGPNFIVTGMPHSSNAIETASDPTRAIPGRASDVASVGTA